MLAGALLAASLVLSPAQIEKIDGAVDEVMAADHIPGLSLGIARNGEVLLLRGYGVRSRDTASVPDGDTTFRIGSLTKQFTAALVLQQVERGKLSLDQTIHGITVQELLAQTSGIETAAGGQTIEAALQKPVFEPGTSWEYSNTNYVVLGDLLESASGSTYATLLAASILDPLKLAQTSMDAPTGENGARPYEWDDGAYIPVDTDFDGYAAAGMTSSARDILTWLDALRAGRVVSPADFEAMVTSQALKSGERTHYGFGWYIRDWYGWKTVEHPGYVDGYSADDALVIDDGLEIVVLCNGTNAYLVPITKTIVSLLETPRDQNLVANFSHGAENEHANVTADVKALVAQLQKGKIDRSKLSRSLNKTLTTTQVSQGHELFAPLGSLTLVEFIERTTANGAAFEKYRLTFGYKQFWMTLSYAKDGKINTLSIEPDED